MAHARDPNFVKEEFQKALKSHRKGWFSGIFGKQKPAEVHAQ
jgi:hypothetical protein